MQPGKSHPNPKRGCRWTLTDLARYAARVSRPVLDRLDLQIEVPALTSDELLRASPGESSASVRERVLVARKRQRDRGGINALLSNAALREHCALDAPGRRLIADAVDRGGMSARGVHRALRVDCGPRGQGARHRDAAVRGVAVSRV